MPEIQAIIVRSAAVKALALSVYNPRSGMDVGADSAVVFLPRTNWERLGLTPQLIETFAEKEIFRIPPDEKRRMATGNTTLIKFLEESAGGVVMDKQILEELAGIRYQEAVSKHLSTKGDWVKTIEFNEELAEV